MSTRPFVLAILFLLPNLALAAPAAQLNKKPSFQPISVDSTAQKVLERAVKLYGKTARWSGQIVESKTISEGVSKISVAYIRPNFVRVENSQGKDTIFEMADGKTVSSYIQSPELGNHSTRKVQLRTLSEILGSSIGSPPATGEYLAALLQGKSGVPKSPAEFKAQNLRSLRVKSLPAATWKNQKCDRVLVEKNYKYKTGEDVFAEKEWGRDEIWFTGDGKLVKVEMTEKYVDEGSDSWKGEILTQSFAPKFNSSIFRFTPPKEKSPKM